MEDSVHGAAETDDTGGGRYLNSGVAGGWNGPEDLDSRVGSALVPPLAQDASDRT